MRSLGRDESRTAPIFFGVRHDARAEYDIPFKLHAVPTKDALLDAKLQTLSTQKVEDDSKVLQMVFHSIGVNDDVVEVGTVKREALEDMVHNILEGLRSSDETERHQLEGESPEPDFEGGVRFEGLRYCHLPIAL